MILDNEIQEILGSPLYIGGGLYIVRNSLMSIVRDENNVITSVTKIGYKNLPGFYSLTSDMHAKGFLFYDNKTTKPIGRLIKTIDITFFIK